jgi:hypothetical protein
MSSDRNQLGPAEWAVTRRDVLRGVPALRAARDPQPAIVMTGGRIVERGPVEAVLGAPSADHTRRVLRNTPSIECALA